MTCAAGHQIISAFAFHADHFLWGHQCPDDGLYWAYDPCTRRTAASATWRDAALTLGGHWQ